MNIFSLQTSSSEIIFYKKKDKMTANPFLMK